MALSNALFIFPIRPKSVTLREWRITFPSLEHVGRDDHVSGEAALAELLVERLLLGWVSGVQLAANFDSVCFRRLPGELLHGVIV